MRRGRIISGFAALAVALAAAGGAQAYDGRIAQDLKDGHLDGSYSQAELSSYLQTAMAQGYGNPIATPPAPAVGIAGAQAPPAQAPSGAVARQGSAVAGAQSPPLAVTRQTGTLPFTGVDLALLVAGGAFMLGLGLVARRLGRNY